MSLFSRFRDWINSKEETHPDEFDRWVAREPATPITFAVIKDVAAPPSDDKVERGTFYRTSRNGQSKWALFRCPCGCDGVITLSLQQTHRPRWLVYLSKGGYPTLRPSVWRDVGCFSHFILQDGRIYWCKDSGTPPDEVRQRFHHVA